MSKYFRRTRIINDELNESESVLALLELDKSIDRRLAIMLVFFVFVIMGSLASGLSSISAIGFSIGSIICWLLAVSIMLTTKKTGETIKTISKVEGNIYAKIEKRLYAKSIRWILGYIIPIFCSLVLTFGSVGSSAGWFNDFWFTRITIEDKIEDLKESLPNIKIEKSDKPAQKVEPDKHYKSVDSLIY